MDGFPDGSPAHVAAVVIARHVQAWMGVTDADLFVEDAEAIVEDLLRSGVTLGLQASTVNSAASTSSVLLA